MVEDEMEKKYSRILTCWQNKIKKFDEDYNKERKTSLKNFNNAHQNIFRFGYLLSEWQYQMQLQLNNNDQQKLIEQIYHQKRQLLNSMFLVFMIANDSFRDTNLGVIRKYSVNMGRKEIYENATEYNILKNITLEKGKTRDEHIKADYNIRVTPDHFDSLKILPLKYIAKIMKFKVGFSSNSTELLSQEELDELKKLKAKSFIIAGNENIELDSELNALNSVELKKNTFNKWKEIATNNNISVNEEQKNKIQEFINDVINENIKTKKMSRRYQNEYETDKKYIQYELSKNHDKVIKINDELFSILTKFNMHPSTNIFNKLPFTVNNLNHIKQLKEDAEKQYLTILENQAAQLENIKNNYDNVQPKIIQLLVDSSFDEENLISEASKKIVSVFNDNKDELCSGALVGSIEMQDHKPMCEKTLIENLKPVLLGFQLPVIKIKPEYDYEQAKFSLPIMLNVRCESIQKSFKYDETNNIILDYSTNISWKVQNKNRYPMKRRGDNEDWEYPRLNNPKAIVEYFNDYQKFCKNYNDFYTKITNKFIS